MNGFIQRTLALGSVVGAALLVGGCCCGKDTKLCDFYDHCWPDRYAYQANQSVMHTFAAQVNNGRVLDQTVWNYHFKAGTSELTLGGIDHLTVLSRRRPQPDPRIFLQTAQDVTYDPAAPEQFNADRAKLDNERREAVQKYLTVATAGRPVSFMIEVHDPSPVGLPSQSVGIAVQKLNSNFTGVLPSGGAAQSGSTSGSMPK